MKELSDEAIRRKEIEEIAAARIKERKLIEQEMKLRENALRVSEMALEGKIHSPGRDDAEETFESAYQKREERRLLKQE